MTITQSLPQVMPIQKKKLYLVPTTDKEFGNELSHPKFSPMPSSLEELPDLFQWSENFVIAVIEVWSGRRSALQLSRNCHRSVVNKIIEQGKNLNQSCQIRKLYTNQPIEGVIEVVVTLRVKDRVRSLTLRFEGVDKRWICTDLNLL